LSHLQANHPGHFFKRPDDEDTSRTAEAKKLFAALTPQFIPDEAIPAGDETTRIHRWRYSRYRELFNVRQLLGLEISCRLIAAQRDASIRNALATRMCSHYMTNNRSYVAVGKWN
jgi:adenine-specific DNA methylase